MSQRGKKEKRFVNVQLILQDSVTSLSSQPLMRRSRMSLSLRRVDVVHGGGGRPPAPRCDPRTGGEGTQEFNHRQPARSRLYRRKRASKQGRPVPLEEKKKREETQVSARNISTPDLILPVHKQQYYADFLMKYSLEKFCRDLQIRNSWREQKFHCTHFFLHCTFFGVSLHTIFSSLHVFWGP